MSDLLKNLSVRIRIGLMSFTTISALILIVVAAILMGRLEEETAQALDKSRTSVEIGFQISRVLLTVRNKQLSSERTKDLEEGKQISLLASGIISDIDQMEQTIDSNGNRDYSDIFIQLRKSMQNYIDNIDHMFLLKKQIYLTNQKNQGDKKNIQEDGDLLRQTNIATKALDSVLKNLRNKDLAGLFVQVQLSQERFQFDSSTKNLKSYTEDYKNFIETFKTSDAFKSIFKIDELIKQYETSTKNLNLVILEINKIKTILDNEFQKVTFNIETVQQDEMDNFLDAQDKATEFRSFSSKAMLFFAIIVLICSLLVSIVIIRSITVPLDRITGAVKRVAGGDMKATIIDDRRRDELGDLARALSIFKENLSEAEGLRQRENANKAENERQRASTLHGVADRLNQEVGAFLQAIANSASDMRGAADSMTGMSSRTYEESLHASSTATQANANMVAVASATEELSQSTNEIGRRVEHATYITHEVTRKAASTDTAAKELGDSTARITEVVQLIRDIAAQTNLLALNATIEAARAGDAGKGFAVVASEVKSLANQTAQATEDITRQVEDIQQASNTFIEAMSSINTTIHEMSEIALSVSSAVEQQSATTREITRNVQDAAMGVSDVSRTITNTSTMAQKTSDASSLVETEAATMSSRITDLSDRVTLFGKQIRDA